MRWHLCKMRKKFSFVNSRWNSFETKFCAVLKSCHHHWIFSVAVVMPRVSVGLRRSCGRIPFLLGFFLIISLPGSICLYDRSLHFSWWALHLSQIVLLIAVNNCGFPFLCIIAHTLLSIWNTCLTLLCPSKWTGPTPGCVSVKTSVGSPSLNACNPNHLPLNLSFPFFF